MAEDFPLNPGSIVVMDRGYNDYTLFGKWTDQKIYFVTRLKDNAAYEVLEEGPVPANRNIRSDQLIQFTGEKAQKDCPSLLRRVIVWDPINEREIVLLTNLMEFGSTTIAPTAESACKNGIGLEWLCFSFTILPPPIKNRDNRYVLPGPMVGHLPDAGYT